MDFGVLAEFAAVNKGEFGANRFGEEVLEKRMENACGNGGPDSDEELVEQHVEELLETRSDDDVTERIEFCRGDIRDEMAKKAADGEDNTFADGVRGAVHDLKVQSGALKRARRTTLGGCMGGPPIELVI